MITSEEALRISNSINETVKEHLPVIEQEIMKAALSGKTSMSVFLGCLEHENRSIIEYLSDMHGYNGWLTEIKQGHVLNISWSKQDDN